MGTLFSALNVSSGALDLFSRALDVGQQNVSNASTAGYAAQRAQISTSFGGAVHGDTISISSADAGRTDASFRSASSFAGDSGAQVESLTALNGLFDITGQSGILAAFQSFGSAFSRLTVSPADPALRAGAITAARQVASAFRSTAQSLDVETKQVDADIASTVDKVNTLASRIAGLNASIANRNGGAGDPGTNAALRDSLDQLSSLVDVTISNDPNGGVTVLAAGQAPLVAGDRAYGLTVQSPNGGPVFIQSNANSVILENASGKLGGLLQVRNQVLGSLNGSASTPGSLSLLASSFATQVNQLLSAGATSTDAQAQPGQPLFTFDPANPSNAARTLNLDPGATAAGLALADPGPPAQSNGVAQKLASLTASASAASGLGGVSFEGFYAQAAAQIGNLLANGQNDDQSNRGALTAAQSDRQQRIGVSLDQEAVSITAYQRAYEASARVIGILNQLTSDEVNLIR